MNAKPQLVVGLAAQTDQGVVRDHNEDDYVIVPDVTHTETPVTGHNSFVLGDGGCVMVVADGMGGAAAGEIASRSTTQLIKKYLLANPLAKYDHRTVAPFLQYLVQKAYENLRRIVNESPEYRGMGTTVVMAWLCGDAATVCWVGDSRCYHLSQKTGLTRMTDDHSWVWEMVKQHKMTPEEAAVHENRNIITRCIGDSPTAPEAEFRTFSIEKGDKILLCSDGLNSMIDEAEMLSIFNNDEDIVQIAGKLVAAANAAGGEDNVTVAVAEVLELYSNKNEQTGVWTKLLGLFARKDKKQKTYEGLYVNGESDKVGIE